MATSQMIGMAIGMAGIVTSIVYLFVQLSLAHVKIAKLEYFVTTHCEFRKEM